MNVNVGQFSLVWSRGQLTESFQLVNVINLYIDHIGGVLGFLWEANLRPGVALWLFGPVWS